VGSFLQKVIEFLQKVIEFLQKVIEFLQKVIEFLQKVTRDSATRGACQVTYSPPPGRRGRGGGVKYGHNLFI
jgi:hypothetical protein